MGLTVGFIAAPYGPFVLSLLVFVGKSWESFYRIHFIFRSSMGLDYLIFCCIVIKFNQQTTKFRRMDGRSKIIFGLIFRNGKYLAPSDSKEHFQYNFPVYIILSGIYLIILMKGLVQKFILKLNFDCCFAIIMGLDVKTERKK